MHLKTKMNYSPTTITEKLRAIRHAIEYVMYQQSAGQGSHATFMKCQEVKDRLKKWGNALTKDVRKQTHIIYLNGQRPGVVQRMTVDEWVEQVEEDGEWVIYVINHKTSGAFGPAKVAVDDEICSLMVEYFLHVRPKIAP